MMTLPQYYSSPSLYTVSTEITYHTSSQIPLSITKITDVLPTATINGQPPAYGYKLEWNTASNLGTGGTVTLISTEENNDFDDFNGDGTDDGYL